MAGLRGWMDSLAQSLSTVMPGLVPGIPIIVAPAMLNELGWPGQARPCLDAKSTHCIAPFPAIMLRSMKAAKRLNLLCFHRHRERPAMPYNILILGAAYGSLLASKMLFGGHKIHHICLP